MIAPRWYPNRLIPCKLMKSKTNCPLPAYFGDQVTVLDPDGLSYRSNQLLRKVRTYFPRRSQYRSHQRTREQARTSRINSYLFIHRKARSLVHQKKPRGKGIESHHTHSQLFPSPSGAIIHRFQSTGTAASPRKPSWWPVTSIMRFTNTPGRRNSMYSLCVSECGERSCLAHAPQRHQPKSTA